MKEEIEWYKSTEFPDELNPADNGFSVDVLIYSKISDEHSVGWFDFKTMKWLFLSNEPITNFRWRYFNDEIDTY